MTDKENFIRTLEFWDPEWIVCGIGFAPLTWHTHREKLEEIALSHPRIFKGYQKGSVDFENYSVVYREGEYFRDNWGCLWYNVLGGLEGQVVEHPLEDWSALRTYQPPDPLTKTERGEQNWEEIKKAVAAQKEKGELVGGNGERLFDRLYFLRGFDNLMIDIATDDPHLPDLIEMLTDYEMKVIKLWLEIGVDIMGFHTDIGTQRALMISPDKFRKYIKPMFKKLFMTCREAGVHVCLSSDGCLLEIVDDLVECGVSMHDPQLRANTLAGIEKAYKGKLCATVDLDRQMFAFCKPEDIRNQVREVVEKMSSPKGGLMLSGSVWDDKTPFENIEALCDAMEEYCF